MGKERKFDVIVIGSGSGLTISSQAAEMGKRVALIEKGAFGGTCLNRGCIPSKILIHTADIMEMIRNSERFNIKAKVKGIDWKAMQKRVWGHIDPDSESIEEGNRENENIVVYKEEAKFTGPRVLDVGGERITADKVFICAGTRPNIPKFQGLDKVRYHTSDDVMRLKQQPKSMIIVGGGFIAAEMAHFFSSIGTDVTLIYRGSVLLRREDKDISEAFTNIAMEKYKVMMDSNPVGFEQKGKTIVAEVDTKGKKSKVKAEALLMATGRVPNSDFLQVDKAGVKTNDRGYIEIDDYTKTSAQGVWAIGDIAGKYLLKHSANLEAQYCAHNAFNPKQKKKVDYHAMPHAVFSSPQIASVGSTEEDLDVKNIPYAIGLYRYYNTGMGIALEEKNGFCKVIVDPKSKAILGCHIMGPHASILIHEVLVAMKNRLGVTGIEKVVHIHPALSEVVQRAYNAINWHDHA